MQIKVLGPNDAGLLEQVAVDVFDDPIHLESTKKNLKDSWHHLVVATQENTVIGFVSGLHYLHPDKSSPEFWINEVAVSPMHQRQGIAKEMLRAVLELAKELGCSEAWVLTKQHNAAAIHLYKSFAAEPSQALMFNFLLSN